MNCRYCAEPAPDYQDVYGIAHKACHDHYIKLPGATQADLDRWTKVFKCSEAELPGKLTGLFKVPRIQAEVSP
jgi:hypothetical protein